MYECGSRQAGDTKTGVAQIELTPEVIEAGAEIMATDYAMYEISMGAASSIARAVLEAALRSAQLDRE